MIFSNKLFTDKYNTYKYLSNVKCNITLSTFSFNIPKASLVSSATSEYAIESPMVNSQFENLALLLRSKSINSHKNFIATISVLQVQLARISNNWKIDSAATRSLGTKVDSRTVLGIDYLAERNETKNRKKDSR